MKKYISLMILLMSFESQALTYDVSLTKYDSINDAHQIAKIMAVYDQVCVPYPTLCLSSISDDSDKNFLISGQNVSIDDFGSILISSNISVINIDIPNYAIHNKGYFLHQYSEMIKTTLFLDQSITTKLKILKNLSKQSEMVK
ncbi:hypothetical protein [Aliivibrio fischeri]|uniref:hypothetical protein n=1 Tax=Aliivibrio fischeri TaxID=668 RepID=UPI0012D9B09D|nr:hypothetical protein [Aliivibrio fischeri]MUJ20351.1 hypothetical protein [Aliivibrio fischeri]